jgi:signal transduction histidine kinase
MKYRHATMQLLSLLTLILLGWSSYLSIHRPTIGVFWGYTSGVIYEVDETHPSAKLLSVGDRIVSGNGLNASQLYKFNQINAGDVIDLKIDRNGKELNFPIIVAESKINTIFERVVPLLIALVFWLSGNLVLAFSRSGLPATYFFLACQSAAITLGAGTISAYGPDWTKALFHLGLIWLAMFTVNLHLVFPVRYAKKQSKASRTLVWGVGLFISAIFIASFAMELEILSNSIIWWATLFILGLSLLATLYFLAQAYRKSPNAQEHHQVGIIILSGIMGIFPTVILTLIPILIAGYPLIPPHYSFLSLVMIPIGYGYAILRYRMIGVDKTINRGTAYSLVALFLGAIYTIMYSLSARFSPSLLNYSPIWVLVYALIFAAMTNKLYTLFLNFVNHILYGGWYDYRSVVENVSHSLGSIPSEDDAIGSVLCQTIGKSMRLDNTSLILFDGSVFVFTDNNPKQTKQMDFEKLNNLFTRVSAKDSDDIFLPFKENIEGLTLIDVGVQDDQPQYLIPLKGKNNKLLGVFIVGKKRDGENLDENDLEILRVVVHQAQVTLENALLLAEAQEHSAKISRLHRQVLRAREEERKRVARDLHDLIIQSLVGVNYRVAEMRVDLKTIQDNTLVETQDEIRRVMTDLRQICADLRPPSLDVLGLTNAIQAKATEIEDGAPFKIRVMIEGNEDQEISEEVKLCIYRLVQESLINVQKHSDADHVEVWVQITSEKIMVSITDNGVGFEVPERFGELTQEKHFGLVGLKEMVEAVSGEFQVNSKPGSGCVLSVEVPL